MMNSIYLKPGRDKSVRNRHPWIFSGALAREPETSPGALVAVLSAEGERLGAGYWNPSSNIRVRMLAFGAEDPKSALVRSLELAYRGRAQVRAHSSGYRIVNGEGDSLPGLIIDAYGPVCVVQIGALGMELLKPEILSTLKAIASPQAVYERSDSASRVEEGLKPSVGPIYGEVPQLIEISEYGMRLLVDVIEGQKTGFFLDQREMRALVRDLGPRCGSVLNCFSYTGGFSVAAGLGGSARVVSVDSSVAALELARKNAELNGLGGQEFAAADVFDYLTNSKDLFDLVIVDPPAFAKKKSHIQKAARAYGDLNRLALRRVAPGGLLLSCSCSHYLEESLLQQILFQSAREIGRQASVIQRHRLAFDHPQSIFHPEGGYLKSFLLSVV